MRKANLLLTTLLSVITYNLFAQAGILDNAFGAGGKVTTSFGQGGSTGWSLVIQDDWSIVVGGTEFNGLDSDFALIRYTPNGAIDSTFGTNGKVTTAMGPGNDIIYSLALQQDGKIIAFGTAWNGTDYDFAMARYTTSGVLDASFGNGGKVITSIGTGNDIGGSLTLQSDWSVVVGGSTFNGLNNNFALARYKTNGTLDSTFGTNGTVITAVGVGNDTLGAVVVQPDSSIVAVGTVYNGATNNFVLARYHANGTLDNGFGSGGKVISTGGVNDDKAFSVALQPDGKIIAGGYSNNGLNDNFAILRYLVDGSIDSSFGVNGRATSAIGDSDEAIYSMVIQPDGKIIGAGSTFIGGSVQYALARYNSNGSPDNSFGTSGMVTTAMGTGNNEAYAVALQPSGKIIAAGYSNNGTNNEFAVARYISGLELGLIDFSLSNNALFIYPNPIQQNATLTYTLGKEERLSIRLLDMQGKVLKVLTDNQTQTTGEHKQAVNFPDELASGPYLINISSASGQMSIKIVK